MVKRAASERPERARSTKAPLKETAKTPPAPLTEDELGRVAGGYIGETEKNLR